jgi:crotonobetainyl-CoA:carnitine CoA-transferase CaiB-like acyl-CoA transferase
MSASAPSTSRAAPLEGVRVLDLTIVWSGPYAAALLADMGAEVIKVEGPGAIDVTRPIGCITDAERDNLYAPYVAGYNRNKLGLAVDLKAPGGRELLLSLAATCDIVMENFRAGVLERLGLGYEELRAVNPDVILLQMPGFASTGPEATRAAYGPVVEAMSGFVGLGGREGEPPLFSGISFSDPVAGTMAAGAVLMALLHRERTGRGQRLEFSQRNNMLGMLGEAFVLFSLTGRTPPRQGNRHPAWVQGCYRCRDVPEEEAPALFNESHVRLTDRWLALSITSDGEWRAIAALIEAERGLPAGQLAEDPRFATTADRRSNQDALDDMLTEWTRDQDMFGLFQLLQAVGVPSAPVYIALDHLDDPHLAARGVFEQIEHPVMGRQRLYGPIWRLSETPQRLGRAAPLFGEHNAHVAREVLGLGVADIAALAAGGVLARSAVRA